MLGVMKKWNLGGSGVGEGILGSRRFHQRIAVRKLRRVLCDIERCRHRNRCLAGPFFFV